MRIQGFLIAIVMMVLAFGFSSCQSNSKPIDQKLADQALDNAKDIEERVNYMADLLDGVEPAPTPAWDADISVSTRERAKAHRVMMEEVKRNADAANTPAK